MDNRTVRYGRIGEVVVMIFPDENGAKEFISRIETQSLLKKIGMEKTPIKPVDVMNSKKVPFKPRVIA